MERLGQTSREPNHKLALIVVRLLFVGTTVDRFSQQSQSQSQTQGLRSRLFKIAASRSKRVLDRESANSVSNGIGLCKSFCPPRLHCFAKFQIDHSCNPDSPSPMGRGSAL